MYAIAVALLCTLTHARRPHTTHSLSHSHSHSLPPLDPITMSSSLSMVSVYPFLFMGSHRDARRKKKLKKLRVGNLVSIGKGLREALAAGAKQGKSLDFNLLVVDLSVDDVAGEHQLDDQALFKEFDSVYAYIESHLELLDGSMMIHCSSGLELTPLFTAAYVLKKVEVLSVDETVEWMVELCEFISFSPEFIQRLRDYKQFLFAPSPSSAPASPSILPESSVSTHSPDSLTPATSPSPPLSPPILPEASHNLADKPSVKQAVVSPAACRYVCYRCRTPLYPHSRATSSHYSLTLSLSLSLPPSS
eukprot:TRINITY_DN7612_c0_g1_i1.p1 TRINITY_DN7612_c0_g1~~TRINITY_DN7612_c0_g1_i1.p1  ORF type:complete len:305 (+),score=77.27 TRINITY_DN7612_c0_g1_i1:312-1226(+)